MKNIICYFLSAAIIMLLNSCKEKTTSESESVPVVSVKAESVVQGNIETLISFNGKTVYLKKNLVVSPISGYVVKADARYGEVVGKEDILFEIQTRESKALGSDNLLNTDIENIKVAASSAGFINEVTINETGGYVVEGGTLCTIVDNNDLMIQLNVPFEYNSIIKNGKNCKIVLPDNSVINGVVYRLLPLIDESNQTQSVLVQPGSHKVLPENLNLTIQFIQEVHEQTMLISKNSLMANETQDEFWVMKILNDTLAVHIAVTKGIVNDSISEVSSPLLNKGDIVIREGAYGLPDSSVIKIVN
jgi:hypothetical protein